jgi:hypothetical protein
MATSGYKEGALMPEFWATQTAADAWYGARTYTTGTCTTGTTAGSPVVYNQATRTYVDLMQEQVKRIERQAMSTDWTDPDYWEKQKYPLTKGKQQFLLEQAQREAYLKTKRPEKTYTEKQMKAKLKEAMAKTKFKSPSKALRAYRTCPLMQEVDCKPTPMQEAWRKANEWLSTVHLTTN